MLPVISALGSIFKSSKNCTSNKSLMFIVGNIFCHELDINLPQNTGKIILPNKTYETIKNYFEKVITIPFHSEDLWEYSYENFVNPIALKRLAGCPNLMEDDYLFSVIFLLIYRPKEGKKRLRTSLSKDIPYLFLAIINNENMRVHLYWNGGHWGLSVSKAEPTDKLFGGTLLFFQNKIV